MDEDCIRKDSMAKRRFVVFITNEYRIGVVSDRFGSGVDGLWFTDKKPDSHCVNDPVVIAFAPGSWCYFFELGEDEDWLDDIDLKIYGSCRG